MYNTANKSSRIRGSGTPSSRCEKSVIKGGDEGVPVPHDEPIKNPLSVAERVAVGLKTTKRISGKVF